MCLCVCIYNLYTFCICIISTYINKLDMSIFKITLTLSRQNLVFRIIVYYNRVIKLVNVSTAGVTELKS